MLLFVGWLVVIVWLCFMADGGVWGVILFLLLLGLLGERFFVGVFRDYFCCCLFVVVVCFVLVLCSLFSSSFF